MPIDFMRTDVRFRSSAAIDRARVDRSCPRRLLAGSLVSESVDRQMTRHDGQ